MQTEETLLSVTPRYNSIISNVSPDQDAIARPERVSSEIDTLGQNAIAEQSDESVVINSEAEISPVLTSRAKVARSSVATRALGGG